MWISTLGIPQPASGSCGPHIKVAKFEKHWARVKALLGEIKRILYKYLGIDKGLFQRPCYNSEKSGWILYCFLENGDEAKIWK